jgi:hypothetical protein
MIVDEDFIDAEEVKDEEWVHLYRARER